MTISLYGIPNCDTVKTARVWLDANAIAYTFHDYKKEGANPARLARWASMVGWEKLLNHAGPPSAKARRGGQGRYRRGQGASPDGCATLADQAANSRGAGRHPGRFQGGRVGCHVALTK